MSRSRCALPPGKGFGGPILAGVAAALVAGCASGPPLSFQLIDAREAVSAGTLSVHDQRMSVAIGDRRFEGFYVTESGVAVNHVRPAWRRPSLDTMSSFYSNSARASLKSQDGQHLFCEFVVEGDRAVGECKSPSGTYYHLVGGK